MSLRYQPTRTELTGALTFRLRADTRPAHLRDRHQKLHGFKRTTLAAVSVVPLVGPSAVSAGAAAALPARDITQALPADIGNVVTAAAALVMAIPTTPYDFSDETQGQLGDCWDLTAANMAAGVDAYFFRNLIYLDPADNTRVIYQKVFAGYVVRVHTSLQVSTSYVQGSPDSVTSLILELDEKVTGLIRSGTDTYAADNLGSVAGGLEMLGFDTASAYGATISAVWTAGQIAAGKTVGINTAANNLGSQTWPVSSHCYWAKAVKKDAAGNILSVTVVNPYHGGDPFDIPAGDINPVLVSALDAGSLPTPLRLQAPAVTTQIPAAPSTAPTSGSYTRVQLQPMLQPGKQGYLPTVGVYGDAILTVPASGAVDVTVKLAVGAAITINGALCPAVNGDCTAKAIQGPIIVTAGKGGGDVLSLAFSQAASAAVPTVASIAATVTLSNGDTVPLTPATLTAGGSTYTVGAAVPA